MNELGCICGTAIIFASVWMASNNLDYWGWIAFIGAIIVMGSLKI